MVDFFEVHQHNILYALLVVCGTFLLRALTNLIYRVIRTRQQEKGQRTNPTSLLLINKIVNTLWIVLGIMAITSLLFSEFYYRLQNNFRLIVYAGILLVTTIIIASTVNIWFKRKIEQKDILKEDPTVFKFMRYVAVFMVYTVGIMFILLAFPLFKGIAQTALGGAGVLALIAGVASQEALANLVGGVFIILFKPFKIGDRIKVSEVMVGTVVDITLRHTVIRNYENKMIVIPNAVINKEKLINYHLKDLRICDRIEFQISYESDIDLAKKIMREECEKHPFLLDNRTATDVLDGKPKVRVALISLNDSSMTVRAWVWARNYEESFDMRCDLIESVKKRFDSQGINIPYPHTTVQFKNSEKTVTQPNGL